MPIRTYLGMLEMSNLLTVKIVILLIYIHDIYTSKSLYYQNLKPIFHCGAKPLASGPCVGLHPQCDDFVLPIPTCWYLKMRKFALSPMPNPNASQWIIGCVGSQTQISGVGHVHFIFFVPISFVFCIQRKPSFQWNIDFMISNYD